MDPPVGVDPVWLAQSRLKRRKWEQCTDLCSKLLSKNPYDQVITGGIAASLAETS